MCLVREYIGGDFESIGGDFDQRTGKGVSLLSLMLVTSFTHANTCKTWNKLNSYSSFADAACAVHNLVSFHLQ